MMPWYAIIEGSGDQIVRPTVVRRLRSRTRHTAEDSAALLARQLQTATFVPVRVRVFEAEPIDVDKHDVVSLLPGDTVRTGDEVEMADKSWKTIDGGGYEHKSHHNRKRRQGW